MNIDYDIFIRTTDDYHIKTVQKILEILYKKNDIYKSEYSGLYCIQCETFYTKHQVENNKCPTCGAILEEVKEEGYFFRLSKYQEKLKNYIDNHEDFIKPKSRQKEMFNNFFNEGLEDICISRTSFKWGIPVTFDEKHIVYVWIDALSNYISALGYLSEDEKNFEKFWPCDVHLVGKEIVRFHAIIWPAILMSLDLPLPKQIFGHGWLVFNGEKMSKSKGNVIDPVLLVEKYGVDSIRYFLMRDISFGQDGNFSNEALINRINFDLANDFGNLLSRTIGMINKYFDGELPLKQIKNLYDEEFYNNSLAINFENLMDNFLFHEALSEIWDFISKLNKYIDKTEPWFLVKEENKKEELAGIMYTLVEGLRVIGILLIPFMPETSEKLFYQLNINSFKNFEDSKTFGLLEKNIKVRESKIIFPRIEKDKK